MVGPFIFIDHMGPASLGPGHYADIGQHPHIGISTLTYLLEGEIVHRDSTGAHQLIAPGSVNWMTAGSGAVHTERTPEWMRDGTVRTMHGYQIWVALPKALENMAPSFHHVEADALPRWQDGAASFTLVAGQGYGRESPVPVHSDLFMVEIKTEGEYLLEVAGQLSGEIGVVVSSGQVEACGEVIPAGNMLVSKVEDFCSVKVEAGSHLFLFGGAPFPEPRFIAWNFVHSDKSVLDEAKQKWIERSFPSVEGDDSYIPYPGHS
ncbi:UNVERIFIED_CONTAM: hypothetical protein GTU68_003498 [Idotea baltica]|nr:hypothetical protein [Idotea baltica]